MVGEYLGDHKDFNVEVLTEYCDIFDFLGSPWIRRCALS